MGVRITGDAIKPVTLTGERIVLHMMRPQDVTALHECVQDTAISTWTTIPSPYTLEMAKSWIAGQPGTTWDSGCPLWGIYLNDKMIGSLHFFAAGENTFEVGYMLAADQRKNGYMTEALRLACRWAFDTQGTQRIVWYARVGNWSSWKTAWQCGFQREGTARSITEAGRLVDHWQASLLAGENTEPATPWDGPGALAAQGQALDPSQPGRLVAQFHNTYSMPDRLRDGGEPTVDYERIHMRMSLIGEEFAELMGAVYGSHARAHIEEAFRTAIQMDDNERDIIESADALADLVYVIYGMALESGVDLDKVLAEVQASNLSKLMPDGTVKLREDGKVLKGPDFFPPNVARALGL